MRNNVAKRGISLIVLIITIVVMLILVSAIVISGDDSRDVAKKAIFISDLTAVEDAVKEYYILNGELPEYLSSEITTKFSASEIRVLNNDADLSHQMIENKDNLSNTTFYLLDIDLLSLDNLNYGLKYKVKTSGTNMPNLDSFMVAYPSMNVYYLKGLKVGGTKYFTLSEELTGKTSVTSIVTDNSTTSISTQTSSGRIRAVKGNTLSATLDLNAIVQLNDGEKFSTVIDGVTTEITTKDGTNALVTGENVVEFSKVLTDAQVTSVISSKSITLVITDSSGAKVEELNVNLDNLTSGGPVFSEAATINSLNDENTVTFTVTSEAGIAYLKYVYEQVFDKENGIKDYYSSLDDTALDSYVYSRGKTASVDSQGSCTIAAPKYVKNLRIVAVDKAGGATYVTKDVSQGLYTTAELNNYAEPNLYINSYVISTNGIKNATISYSLDGTTFTGQTPYTSNTQGQVKDMKTILYENISANVIYIKVEATNYDSSLTTSSVTKLTLKGSSDDDGDDDNNNNNNNNNNGGDDPSGGGNPGDGDGSWDDESNVNTPLVADTGLIPVYWNGSSWVDLTESSTDAEWAKWYDYDNQMWANARSKDGSMWVWIPRYEYVINSDTHEITIKFIPTSQTTPDDGYTYVHPAFMDGSSTGYPNGEWNKELPGFWVAKYEAGFQACTTDASDAKTPINGTDTIVYSNINYTTSGSFIAIGTATTSDYISYPVFKALTYSYNKISSKDAYYISLEIANATDFYGLTNVNSHLMKNSEWGAVAYLAQSKYGRYGTEVTINAKNLSNLNSKYIYAITGYANSQPNGVTASTTENMTGVFDMSGGVAEWTAGVYSTNTTGFTSDSMSTRYLTRYPTNNISLLTTYGDAIKETKNWNSDYSYFVNSSAPVFTRGGYYSDGSSAGLFAFYYDSAAYTYYNYGFRAVLAF